MLRDEDREQILNRVAEGEGRELSDDTWLPGGDYNTVIHGGIWSLHVGSEGTTIGELKKAREKLISHLNS